MHQSFLQDNMMHFLSFSLLIFFYFFLLLSKNLQASTSHNLIYDTCIICSQEYYPNLELHFCTTSLQAAIPATHTAATDIHKLGRISIILAQRNVTDTKHYVKQVLKKRNSGSPYLKAGFLADCLELYSGAISSTKHAMKYYKTKQYDEANRHISSVMIAATTCEDGLAERKGFLYPLTKRNNDASELSAIVLSILRILQTRSH